jgi:hypothetical protein
MTFLVSRQQRLSGNNSITDDSMVGSVVQERQDGLSIRKIADKLGLNRGIVLKICQSQQI